MNNDTLLCIFDYLQLNDILNCYHVCKHYHHVANNESKWKLLFNDKFVTVNGIIVSNYQIQYKRHHKLNKFLMSTCKKNINECIKCHEFDFTCINVHYIPPEFGLLIYVIRLVLTGNKLKSVPSELGQLVNLRELHLDSNRLEFIPPELGQLLNLKILRLECNKLKSVPLELGLLINLDKLNLNGNYLKSIPLELGHLINLRELTISHNELLLIPAPAFSGTRYARRIYMRFLWSNLYPFPS